MYTGGLVETSALQRVGDKACKDLLHVRKISVLRSTGRLQSWMSFSRNLHTHRKWIWASQGRLLWTLKGKELHCWADSQQNALSCQSPHHPCPWDCLRWRQPPHRRSHFLPRAVRIEWLFNMKRKGHAPRPGSGHQLQNSLCDQLWHPLRWHQSSSSPSVQPCFLPFPFKSVQPKRHCLINFMNINLGCRVCFPT